MSEELKYFISYLLYKKNNPRMLMIIDPNDNVQELPSYN